MKSIMHQKDGTCYLCMKLNFDYSTKTGLQEHHVIFGMGNRKLSERYGLKVYLCSWHHLASGGPEAVHRNENTRRMLCRDAQRCFEKHYPGLSFREIFGKNWLEDEKESTDKGDGFTFIQGLEEEC